MTLITRAQILKADDLTWEDVPVPEWKEKDETDIPEVRLLSLTGTQRDDFEAKSVTQGKGGTQKMNLSNFRARLLALCMVDESNKRMFSDIDVNLLGQKNAGVLERLFDKAREMNGMSEKDVEELTEDFSKTPNDSSHSD
jgi:hypothetical protein